MTQLPFAATTPVAIKRVSLRSRDAAALATYYKSILGLSEMRNGAGTIGLGAGGCELLEIEEDKALRPDDPRSAGLFHTAFLLPSRADLAQWVHHASQTRIKIDGASDHLVSEALYLTDPEGNGIEIYADRDPTTWQSTQGDIAMATDPLDIQSLMAELEPGDAGWQGAPDGTVIGHVHLRVGDPAVAEQWWRETMGFETMARYGTQAVFLATGGYHHHIGANSWRSAGAGRREDDRTGLGFVELSSRLAEREESLRDPWGTQVKVVPLAG